MCDNNSTLAEMIPRETFIHPLSGVCGGVGAEVNPS